ncbi:MAG TPA: HNH endonuclease signature motif containing protein [Candidatus Thermoplasmatota archaeon]|nr:HNH endonuclease signature motif containing protein [Candidatus Thermoplasmatota archaeon]
MHAPRGVAWDRSVGSTKRLLARELLLRYGVLKCPVCGDEKDVQKLTKHHIHPRSLGGPTDLRNLVLICRHCHDNVHQFPSAFWARAALEAFLNCRGVDQPFPPPPEPEEPVESLRFFFVRASARSVRDRNDIERTRNPPFNPKWRIARHFPPLSEAALNVPAKA